VTAPTLTSVAGTAKVVRFNWPKYAGALGLLLAALLTSWIGAGPTVRATVWLAAALGCAWSASSLFATWWVYDHSRVYDHVANGLGAVGEWVTIHAGFDDATPALAAAVARPPARVVEVATHARSSLRRARTTHTPDEPASCTQLRLATGSVDTIFLTFAVHELRGRREQRALFAELHRALRPGGRLVITEHLRDLANATIYGPGALHFQTANVWRARAAESGFVPVAESTITPYVRRFTWNR
jgi:SAM-dependent methyltransferase